MLLRTASNFVIGGTDQRLGDKQSHKSEPRTRGLRLDWPVGEQLCGDSLKGDSSGGDKPPGGGTGHTKLPRGSAPGKQTVGPKWLGPLFGESKG